MKNVVYIISFFISIATFGQKMPSDYFDEASKYFEEEKLDSALRDFQYIVDHYPKNELFPQAFYNVGHILHVQKKYDKAIPIFKAILESNFSEKDKLSGGIMDDPYAGYKHRASSDLSEIYYSKKKFDEALDYFILSDTVYPYSHFCGNAYASNDVNTALRYSVLYQKLNQPDKAVEKLLPAVFITLADNSKVIAELKKLLSNRKKLKQELDNSLDKIYPVKKERDNYSYTLYYFKFLSVEVEVPYDYFSQEKEFNKERKIEEIKQTDFYKMIERLN